MHCRRPRVRDSNALMLEWMVFPLRHNCHSKTAIPYFIILFQILSRKQAKALCKQGIPCNYLEYNNLIMELSKNE